MQRQLCRMLLAFWFRVVSPSNRTRELGFVERAMRAMSLLELRNRRKGMWDAKTGAPEGRDCCGGANSAASDDGFATGSHPISADLALLPCCLSRAVPAASKSS